MLAVMNSGSVASLAPEKGRRFNFQRSGGSLFGLTCDALQVYLQLATGTGRTMALMKMDFRGGNRWRLSLNLKPGRYRYRYYAVCGRITTYICPAEVEESPARMDGMDAVRDVPGLADVGEDL